MDQHSRLASEVGNKLEEKVRTGPFICNEGEVTS